MFTATVSSALWWILPWKAGLLGFVTLRDLDWLISCFLLMSAMNSLAIQRNIRQTGKKKKRQLLEYGNMFIILIKNLFFYSKAELLDFVVNKKIYLPHRYFLSLCYIARTNRWFFMYAFTFWLKNVVFLIVWVQYFWSKQRKVLPVSWRFVAALVLPMPSVACWSSVRPETWRSTTKQENTVGQHGGKESTLSCQTCKYDDSLWLLQMWL